MNIESLVPRLGEYLENIGLIQSIDLTHALEVQELRRRNGERLLLGQVLLELGYIDRATLDKAITRQVIAQHKHLVMQNQRLVQQLTAKTTELETAVQKLGDLNQLKDNFVGAVSHELRTPLTHILGYLALIDSGAFGLLDPDLAGAVKAMRNAGNRLSGLIEELLSFSHAYRSELQLSVSPTPLATVLRPSVEETLSKAQNRNIKLQVNAPRPLPVVHADKEKIRWAVTELLTNAIKFTDPGGQVDLLTKQTNERSVYIIVRDTGAGIPTQRIEEIFDPFHQLDGGMNRRADGLGLGLTLVQSIVQAHSSRLHIRSEVGHGTQVAFALRPPA